MLKTLEDYIHFLSGYKDATGKQTSHSNNGWLAAFATGSCDGPVSLARQDEGVIYDFSQQLQRQVGFTQKQCDLARHLIKKYTRQMVALGVSVDHDTPTYLPLRVIDQTKRAWISNGMIHLKFPYQGNMITSMREFAKHGCGKFAWNKQHKQWDIACTEQNVNVVVSFCRASQIECCDQLIALFHQITELEQTPYSITLETTAGGWYIDNAHTSLLEYLAQREPLSFIEVCDMSALLGYTLSDDITNALMQEYGAEVTNMIVQKNTHMDPVSKNLETILKYACLVGRFPVVLFGRNNQTPRVWEIVNKYFTPDEVQVYGSSNIKAVTHIPKDKKLVVCNNVIKSLEDPIPLLVSMSGLLYGPHNQIWIQNAEKIVYHVEIAYNNSGKLI
jgi:hypothetical protein